MKKLDIKKGWSYDNHPMIIDSIWYASSFFTLLGFCALIIYCNRGWIRDNHAEIYPLLEKIYIRLNRVSIPLAFSSSGPIAFTGPAILTALRGIYRRDSETSFVVTWAFFRYFAGQIIALFIISIIDWYTVSAFFGAKSTCVSALFCLSSLCTSLFCIGSITFVFSIENQLYYTSALVVRDNNKFQKVYDRVWESLFIEILSFSHDLFDIKLWNACSSIIRQRTNTDIQSIKGSMYIRQDPISIMKKVDSSEQLRALWCAIFCHPQNDKELELADIAVIYGISKKMASMQIDIGDILHKQEIVDAFLAGGKHHMFIILYHALYIQQRMGHEYSQVVVNKQNTYFSKTRRDIYNFIQTNTVLYKPSKVESKTLSAYFRSIVHGICCSNSIPSIRYLFPYSFSPEEIYKLVS